MVCFVLFYSLRSPFYFFAYIFLETQRKVALQDFKILGDAIDLCFSELKGVPSKSCIKHSTEHDFKNTFIRF